MLSVSYWARNKEDNNAHNLERERKHQLNIDPTDSCEKLQLIEEAIERIENLSRWTAYNIHWRVECRREVDLESWENNNDLKII